MNLLKYLAAGAVAMTFAVPAIAQDTAVAAPSGFRLEGLVGWDHVVGSGDQDNGVLFGIGAGYELALGGPIALGLDAEISDATTKAGGVHAGRDLYAGGRVSFAVSPRANLYIKGGYTNARAKISGFGGENLDGVRAGAGLQYAISGKTYVGAEYRYSNYELDLERHQVALTFGTRF